MSDYRGALCAVVERLIPGVEALFDNITYEVLSEPQPCERCGTTIVLIRWPDPARNWFEVTEADLRARLHLRPSPADTIRERTAFPYHLPARCTAARMEALAPKQLTLDIGGAA